MWQNKFLGLNIPPRRKSLGNLALLYYGKWASTLGSRAAPTKTLAPDVAERPWALNIPTTAQSLSNSGTAVQGNGRVRQGRAALPGSAPDLPEGFLGPEHPDTATSLHNLAGLYHVMGEYVKAEAAATRKRSGSSRRSLALNIPPRRPSSTTRPRRTCIWATTAKPNRSFRKRSREIWQKVLGLPKIPTRRPASNNLATV